VLCQIESHRVLKHPPKWKVVIAAMLGKNTSRVARPERAPQVLPVVMSVCTDRRCQESQRRSDCFATTFDDLPRCPPNCMHAHARAFIPMHARTHAHAAHVGSRPLWGGKRVTSRRLRSRSLGSKRLVNYHLVNHRAASAFKPVFVCQMFSLHRFSSQGLSVAACCMVGQIVRLPAEVAKSSQGSPSTA
jgi:hypothetical protein